MRISDWSSDVCSSDLGGGGGVSRSLHDPQRVVPLRQQFGFARLRLVQVRFLDVRSEERRVGKECAVRVDLGGRRIIKKKLKIRPVERQQTYHIIDQT